MRCVAAAHAHRRLSRRHLPPLPRRRDAAGRAGARRGLRRRRRRHAARRARGGGPRGVGLERAADAAGHARRRCDRPRARRERFAAIVFWHSLEHLPRAGRRAGSCRGAAAPARATSSVAVPNAASLQARAFGGALARARPAAPPRPHPGARACWARLRGRSGSPSERVEPLARRAGRVRLAARPRGRAARPPDLYDAIRRPEAARQRPPARRRAAGTAHAGRRRADARPARRSDAASGRCVAAVPPRCRPPGGSDPHDSRPGADGPLERPPGKRSSSSCPPATPARTLERTYDGDPARLGRRDHPRRRQVHRRHRRRSRAGCRIHVIWHPHNVGYGGNQKTCYLEALQRGADVVVMLHPDGQYEPTLIPRLVEPILRRRGRPRARLAPGRARRGPRRRHAALQVRRQPRADRRSRTASWAPTLSELHTGYRAYSRELLLTIPFLRNALDFSFDSEMLMQARALRLPHRRGARRDRATSTTPRRSACGRRPSTGLKTLLACAAAWCCTAAGIWRIAQVPAVTVTGERVTTPQGGFNPTWQRHVAAYALCAAAAAGRRPRARPRLRRRALLPPARAARDRRRRPRRRRAGAARTARPSSPTCASCRSPTGSFAAVLVGPVDRARARTPSGCWPRSARVLEPGGVAVFVTPNRLTFGRPDEIIDPYHYVEYDRRAAARRCADAVRGGARCYGLFGSRALPRARRRRARAPGPPAAPGPAARAAARARAARASVSTTGC